MHHSIDSTIMVVYLSLTVAIGFYYSGKIKTMRDFAMGSQPFGVFATTATLAATLIGAGTIGGTTAMVYRYGISKAFLLIGVPIQMLFINYYILPILRKRFAGCISFGEVMQKLYGQNGRLIGGIFAVLLSIGTSSIQVGGTGHVLHALLKWDYEWGAALGASAFIFYSTLGGLRAVVSTDVLQVFILSFALPMTFLVGYLTFGQMDLVMASIPPTHWNIMGNMSGIEMILGIMVFALGAFLHPPMIQRFLAAKDEQAVRHSIFSVSLLYFLMTIFVAGTGLLSYAFKPDLNPDEALPYFMINILPPGLLGIAVIGLLAAFMSTADSFLNTGSISFVHDILGTFFKKPLTTQRELFYVRLSSGIIGFSTLFLCIFVRELMALWKYAFFFWAPISFIVVAGILGYKISQHGFIATIITGSLISICWAGFVTPEFSFIDPMLIGFFSTAFIFICFYRLKRIIKI